MPVESEKDRLELLSDFGVKADLGGRSITGILDDEWIEVGGIESQVPIFTARRSDTNSASRGDTIHINTEFDGTVKYTVAEIRDDGQGMVNIILQKA